MGAVWTRRLFVCSLASLAAGEQSIPSEQRKLRDPVTEFDLLRLTDPRLSNCILPKAPLRAISQNNNSLVYSSDRSGTVRAYRMDLKSGESREFNDSDGADPQTISFLPDDRSIVLGDADGVHTAGSRARSVYKAEPAWKRTAFALAEDGQHVILGESNDGNHRLRLIPLSRGATATLAEPACSVQFAAARPKRAGLLYGCEDGLWLVHYDGQGNRKLKAAAGSIPAAQWSADGRTILYLLIPAEGGRLNEMREITPDINEDKLIARTSQFTGFDRNVDGSVFAGVSANKGSPYVLLLLRVARRELTLAEHRASNALGVAIHFAPNSQKIFWHSDREGKHAIYSMAVERFVEATEVSSAYCTQFDAAALDA